MKYPEYLIFSLGMVALFSSALGLASGTGSETDFLRESDTAMTRMMNAMAPRPTGDTDRDFVTMMIPHHEGAIEMAAALVRHGHNEQLKRLAQEIIITQQQEIAAMRLAIAPESTP